MVKQGYYAIFGCGEADGSGTADILDVRTMKITTVTLKGGARKKCAVSHNSLCANPVNVYMKATSIELARDEVTGIPSKGKILIGGGYKSVV